MAYERLHRQSSDDYQQISRRGLLKRGAAVGLSIPAISLLAACGGDDDDDGEAAGTTTEQATASEDSTESEESGAGSATAEETDAATSEDQPEDSEASSTAQESSDQGAVEGQPGGTLKYALHRDPVGLLPHVTYGATSHSLQGNVYDTLVAYDADGSLVPSLAESWEIEDDRTYLLHLREDVSFHNGNPFTADDVIFSFEHILNEETQAANAEQLARMESFEAVDDLTVRVTLTDPYATFLAVLADIGSVMIDKEWTEAGGNFDQEMNGTGPFLFDSFEREVQYTLVKNPNYWKPDLPYLDRIELFPTEDANARINSFRSGQVNFAEYIPWQFMEEIESSDDFALYKGFDIFEIVRLNPNREPLNDPVVRQALNYAIDRQAVIDVAFGGQGRSITSGLIPEESMWFNEELKGHWTYDPQKAEQLLTEGGYVPSNMTLMAESFQLPAHLDPMQVIIQHFEALGITVELQVIDAPTLLEKRKTGEYQVLMDGLSRAYPDPDFYSEYFQTGAPGYAAGVDYSKPELDQLLDEGRSTIDPEQRKEIYLEFEKGLLEDAPWVFAIWRPQAEASASNVKGYVRVPQIGTDSVGYMERVWIDNDA